MQVAPAPASSIAGFQELGPDDDDSWLTRESNPQLAEELQRREQELEEHQARKKQGMKGERREVLP